MTPKKLRRDLIGIAVMSFGCLLLNVAGCIFLYQKSKTIEETIPVLPNVQAVPLDIHKNSLAFTRLLETTVMPAFSCGYLLIGLLVLRHYGKMKNVRTDEPDV